MVEGREMSEWNRTSHILAWLQNWSGFADRAVGPGDLNPYLPAVEGPELDAADLALMFCGEEAVKYFAACDAKKKAKAPRDGGA